MKIYLILLILLPFSLWGEEPTDGKISAELQTQVLRQEDVQEDLSHEKASAEKMAKEAESRAASAKEQANKAETETEKALADFLSNLQQYKASVAQQKLDTVNRIQEKISDISAKTEVLKKYERKIKRIGSAIT